MSVATMSVNTLAQIEQTIYRFDRQTSELEWQLEDTHTGKYVCFTITELLVLLQERRLRFIVDHDTSTTTKVNTLTNTNIQNALSDLPEVQQEETKKKYFYVNEILRSGITSFTEKSLIPIIKQINQKSFNNQRKPHWVTVAKWTKKFTDSGKDIRALISSHRRKGNRKIRHKRMRPFVEEAISTIFLTRERGSVQSTIDHAITLVAKENGKLPKSEQIPLPKRSLVKSMINNIPLYDRYVARYGYIAALHKFRNVEHHSFAEEPLLRVEIDHTIIDCFVIDDNSGLPLGRPTLTICIDVNTRCVLGIYLGFEPASFNTVAQCLKHAFLPKTDLKDMYPEINNDWLPYGVMVELVVDNGLEFHSSSLESLCYSFGISIQYAPRKTPWAKAIVERVISTLNKQIPHNIPGTTFSNIFEKGDYDPQKNAIVSLATLKKIINKWIVDVYHQSHHRGIGMAPIDAWKARISPSRIPLPTSIDDVDSLLGVVVERKLTHKGIELEHMFYNSPLLRDARKNTEHKNVKVRYNPDDMGHIYVSLKGSHSPIRVPNINLKHIKGLTLFQLKTCRKYAVNVLGRSDIEAIAQAKFDIRKIIQEEAFNKTLKSKRKAARFTQGSTKVSSDSYDDLISNTQSINPPTSLPDDFLTDLEDDLLSDVSFKPRSLTFDQSDTEGTE